ncbi:hypothetical protein [Aquimarina sp. TRL1]|uniref:hypothetical protein n=1 Tax=Aquimarina sp. (strain TRL1) TaxID=2736252 RepID=UPI0020CAE00C|nr:hypothetical protein [Aquimarina sp. TRL1]
MPDKQQAILYMVSNPVPFESYDDHEAGIYIYLHELIERSMAEGESPTTLIEEYLETPYVGGHSLDEIASFLFYHDRMVSALWRLQQNWDGIDMTLPGHSLMFGAMAQKEAIQLYSEVTLRTYLEALTTNIVA